MDKGSFFRHFVALLLAAVFAAPVLLTVGCEARMRVYDSDHHEHHDHRDEAPYDRR